MSKSQNNKKAAVLALLGVTALGAYAISGTYAKYISTASGSDTAQVAKWSFKVGDTDITGTASNTFTFDLFDEDKVYNYTDSCGNTDDALVADGESNAIIAPGTCGSFEIELENDSEVTAAYKISYTATNGSNIPIEFSTDQSTWTSTISSLNLDYASDTTLQYDSNNTASVTVYWRWVYETTNGDTADTTLGVAAQETAPTVTVQATVEAKQLNVNIPE